MRSSRLLAGSLFLALSIVASPAFGAAAPTTRAGPATTRVVAAEDHFIYSRYVIRKGGFEGITLVLAAVRPGSFELRDVTTLPYGSLRPLQVNNGRLFVLSAGRLLVVDLGSGQTSLIEDDCRGVYHDGWLYTLAARDKVMGVRVVDLGLMATRWIRLDAAEADPETWSLSPDGRHLAWFTQAGGAAATHTLFVADLAAEKVSMSCPNIVCPTGGGMQESRHGGEPCHAWLDNAAILFMRGEDQDRTLASIDIATGKITDRLTVPRRVYGVCAVRVPEAGGDVALFTHSGPYRFRADLKTQKVTASPTREGQFLVDEGGSDWEWDWRGYGLWHGAKRLDGASPMGFYYRVSPSGQRILWKTVERGVDHTGAAYYDAAEGKTRLVGKDFAGEPFLWVDPAELKARPIEVTKGWEAMKLSAWPPPARPDTRPASNTIVEMKLSTDKAKYLEHEPVELIVTLTNKGKEALKVREPTPGISQIMAGMEYPDGGRSLDWPYALDGLIDPPEAPMLQPGQSVVAKRTFEVFSVGKHTADACCKAFEADWRDVPRGTPVEFVVERAATQEERDEMLKKKVARLMERSIAAWQKRPERALSIPALSDLANMGAPAVMPMIEAIGQQKDAKLRARLMEILPRMECPAAVGTYESWLVNGPNEERAIAIQALRELAVGRTTGKQDALVVLLAGMQSTDGSIRQRVAQILREVHDARVAAQFEAAIAQNDGSVEDIAARYLAAYEGTDLIGWLSAAIDQPTRARGLGARWVFGQLQKEWEFKAPELPGGPWDKIARDEKLLAQYRAALKAALDWATENSSASNHFFDLERQYWPREQE